MLVEEELWVPRGLGAQGYQDGKDTMLLCSCGNNDPFSKTFMKQETFLH